MQQTATTTRLSRRDRLIDKVLRGEVSPQRAESLALKRGIGPLAHRPDINQFDPMSETFWSLPMSVVWIAWRSSNAVREFWDSYRSECWDWAPRSWRSVAEGKMFDGHELKQRDCATPLTLTIAGIAELEREGLHFGVTRVDSAKKELWQALGENIVQASAIDGSRSHRVTIPADEWGELDWYEHRAEDPVALRVNSGPLEKFYSRIRLRSVAIVSLWQPVGPNPVSLPDTITPVGAGHVPLYCAAQWIATKGGTESVDPSHQATWQSAYGELLSRVSCGQVEVTGLREGKRQAIDPKAFIAIAVDYPFVSMPNDLRQSEELYLRCYPYAGDRYWRNGFDDSLCDRTGPQWTKLMVAKPEVAKWWPFGLALIQTDGSTRTGAPGRPSSMHLIEAEFIARCTRREALLNLKEESEVLASWFRQNNPSLPSVTPKTISNRLREEHRRWRAGA